MTTGGSGENAGWLRYLFGYCLRQRRNLVLAYGAAAVAAAATATIPLAVRHVIDNAAVDTNHALAPWIAVLVALATVRFAAAYTRRYRSGQLSLGVQYDLRGDAFRSLLRLDGVKQDGLQTGQVVSRSISDITLIQMLLQLLPHMAGNLLMFTMSLAVMAVLSPILTLVALAVLPALWFISMRSRVDLFPANWHAQEQAAIVAGGVEAAVTGVRVVKGFGQEDRELEDLEKRAGELFRSRLRVARLTSRYNPALQAVPMLGQALVLAVGGWLALHGDLSLGTFVAFTTYLAAFASPVRQLATLLTVSQQGRASVERVREVIDNAPAVTTPPDAVDLPGGPLEVVFDDVAFGYAPSNRLLDGLSLRIAPGETVAVVGAAGSGKSTLAMLVPRLYDADAGAVTVGGIDTRRLSLESLRSALGVVFEDSYLMSETIRANVSYGRPDVDETLVREALRVVQAEEFVDALPDGLDTVVGEQGVTLSGGQRQRIALARALVTDPRILVLDDATSAVDARVEAAVHHELRAATGERTTLIIAHRRSTLALADRIAVLAHGRIVDVGTSAELDERCPLFRALLSSADDAAGPDTSPELPDVDGVTAELWRRTGGDEESGVLDARAVAAFATAVAGASGPSRGGAGGGILSSAPPSPEVMARLDDLPPLTGDPDVAADEARAADPAFGLGSLLRPLLLPLVAGLALVGLDAVAQIAVPVLVRTGVDRGVLQGARDLLLLAAAATILVVLLDWAVNVAQARVTGRTGERLLYTLRVKTFAQLQRLGLQYYERELAGRIMTRMTTDVDSLSNFLQTGLATAVVSGLTICGVLVALLVIDAELALVLGLVVPVLVAATVVFRRKSVPAYAEARDRVGIVNAYLQENVTNIRVTQAFRREDDNAAQFSRRAWDFRESRLRAQRYMALYFPFVEFLSVVATGLVLAVGTARIHAGSLTVGTLIAFVLYVELFFAPVQQLSQVFDGYQQAVIGLGRLRGLMRTPTTTPQAGEPVVLDRIQGGIAFDDVHFGYESGKGEALRGVTLRIEPGETVALVGQTGAGKSTVLKLLARFYDPTEGAVRVDGIDTRSLDLASFRQRLGVVPQEPHLFGATVRDAVAYGRLHATDAEVEAASRAVGAHEMVSGLALGYLQPIGEHGRNLSAGQRQLLALARAELVDPDILLLDEATASLDLATEDRVRLATENLSRRRTTVVVAHRLSTAARADRVVVLDAGRVAEIGTHDELLDRGGVYRELWDAYAPPAPVSTR
ncbi:MULTISPECIES: ABC transporter ATP-binding protein [unclassified Rhodococcus (in: high G+C Gram-positive bacteria)]|uniref:ABC transporter ATP-binding protein n=1 Tax=unclassified Rhodococcus (in: high G+C Gram-positive bacteria) TaxID=192944 RepID=UPI00163958F9|nr:MULTISPECIES: ABC transporter ATP-binding protein [unclassified Rhodococcus (in: high G+C Gram-positive bacteria)]MBC2639757.1 ABC transporter ATP-binding protein [Rhodococcus sp. 3A]MBC2895498.1 ABC transporter ATP-binding protein [Rhodococcus sp. 4CII]